MAPAAIELNLTKLVEQAAEQSAPLKRSERRSKGANSDDKKTKQRGHGPTALRSKTKLIAGGRYALGVGLQSCVDKFVFHIPIERQVRIAAARRHDDHQPNTVGPTVGAGDVVRTVGWPDSSVHLEPRRSRRRYSGGRVS